MNKEKTIAEINRLESKNSLRFYKYQRNIRLYTWSPTLSLNEISSSQSCGYYSYGTYEGEGNTSSIQENVINSCIETLVSKIASTKVRPFINTVHGSFKDIKIAKQTQTFFDLRFEEENINKVVSEAFRDSCIFDTGVVYIDDCDNYKIKKMNPWQVYTDPAEVSYGKVTKVAVKQKCYPVSLLKQQGINITGSYTYVTKIDYYDTVEHQHAVYIPEVNKYVSHEYKSDKVPFIFMYYKPPVVGNTSTSVTDLLYGIQMKIDEILRKISDAVTLNPALTFFVPEGSQIKANQLDNRIGNIITYRPSPNMTQSPVTSSTPAFIDSSYIQLLSQLKQDAYEMIGISQLSATSQKPQGLDSGTALQTLENIESDRFEVQLNQVVRCYTDLARLYIDIVPEDEDILPEDNVREEITWADIKNAAKQMNIQFSGANSLSKDPETKLRQINMLTQAGIIPRARIATLMEVPDLEAGYSISNNALNATLAVIDDCINKDLYDIPFYIPTPLLMEEIANTMLSLTAADKEGNKPDIDKLKRLFEIVVQQDETNAKVLQQEKQNEMMQQQNEQLDLQNEMMDDKNKQMDQNIANMQQENMTLMQQQQNQMNNQMANIG